MKGNMDADKFLGVFEGRDSNIQGLYAFFDVTSFLHNFLIRKFPYVKGKRIPFTGEGEEIADRDDLIVKVAPDAGFVTPRTIMVG